MRFIVAAIVVLITNQISYAQIKVDKLEQSIKNDISTNKIGRNDLKGFIELQKIKNDRERLAIEASAIHASNYQKMGEGAYKFAIAAYSNQMLEILKYEFKRIILIEKEFDRIRLNHELKINLALDLKSGKTNKGTWIGLDHIFKFMIPSTILEKELFKEVPKIPSNNFIYNVKKDKDLEFPGGNLGEFLEFLKENDCSTKPYSKAHLILLNLFSNLDTIANKNIEYVSNDIEKIRKTALPVFKVPEAK